MPVFVLETRSQEAEAILRASDKIFISSLTQAEFLVALNRLRKLGTLSQHQHDLLAGTLEGQIQKGLLNLVPIELRHFDLAVELARRCGPIVRTLDALHLAATNALGVPLATFDHRLLDAAKSVGIDSIG